MNFQNTFRIQKIYLKIKRNNNYTNLYRNFIIKKQNKRYLLLIYLLSVKNNILFILFYENFNNF